MAIIQTDKPLRPRESFDFYPTPLACCIAALQRLAARTPGWHPDLILDPGAGEGPWGEAYRRVWGGGWLVGSELRAVPVNRTYDAWYSEQNFLEVWADQLLPPGAQGFDLIIGNPPYREAEPFIRRSLQLLNPGGYLIFLLRIEFLCGQRRGKDLWKEFKPRYVDASSRRPSFTGNGKTDATDYALFTWQQGYHGPCELDFLSWTE